MEVHSEVLAPEPHEAPDAIRAFTSSRNYVEVVRGLDGEEERSWWMCSIRWVVVVSG